MNGRTMGLVEGAVLFDTNLVSSASLVPTLGLADSTGLHNLLRSGSARPTRTQQRKPPASWGMLAGAAPLGAWQVPATLHPRARPTTRRGGIRAAGRAQAPASRAGCRRPTRGGHGVHRVACPRLGMTQRLERVTMSRTPHKHVLALTTQPRPGACQEPERGRAGQTDDSPAPTAVSTSGASTQNHDPNRLFIPAVGVGARGE